MLRLREDSGCCVMYLSKIGLPLLLGWKQRGIGGTGGVDSRPTTGFESGPTPEETMYDLVYPVGGVSNSWSQLVP